MTISIRVGLLLILICFVPNAVLILLLENSLYPQAQTLCLIIAVCSLVALVPAAKLITYLIIGRDLHKMNELCHEVKNGHYGAHFTLPLESEHEHELLKLKRNMNWMLHSVASREELLQNRLEVVTKNKQEYEKLSYVDGLTGIYNRRYFDEIFPQLCEDAVKSRRDIALILIDCDGFKQINDNFGHQAGDDILILLGGILQRAVRENHDFPFRYGGDEFGIILSDIPSKRLLEIAETVRERFEVGNNMNATLSIGAAICAHTNSPSVRKLKENADAALYKSKNEGKNRIYLHNTENREPADAAD